MQWLSTGGGPFVCISTHAAAAWKGAAGDDYALACAVRGYTGIIQWRDVEVLVLGDEPLETSIWIRGGRPRIVRWIHAPDEASLVECITSQPKLETVETHRWTVTESTQLIFDSAMSGSDVNECLHIALAPGVWSVETYIARCGSVAAMIHEFVECVDYTVADD